MIENRPFRFGNYKTEKLVFHERPFWIPTEYEIKERTVDLNDYDFGRTSFNTRINVKNTIADSNKNKSKIFNIQKFAEEETHSELFADISNKLDLYEIPNSGRKSNRNATIEANIDLVLQENNLQMTTLPQFTFVNENTYTIDSIVKN